jgi:hypothetical protein
MKTTVVSLITVVVMFFYPSINYAQDPDFGSAANFVLFTTNGSVTNTGVSQVTGDIGTNNGLITGFLTSVVTGSIHNADAVAAQCSTDLLAAYNQLNSITTTSAHIAVLGNGEVLNAGVYSIAAAGSLGAVLTLDAQGDTNAIFIFKIGAAFTTAASSTISLIHGASASRVFWLAEGAIAMAASTTMKGTLIAHNAAISIGAGSTLAGRMFSTGGDVTLDALSASLSDLPAVIYEQAPNLGSLANFVLFTVTGAVGNTGSSMITGNVGTNLGSITGFGPGNLIGSIHNGDAATVKCSTDLMNAYDQLSAATATSIHLPVLGNGETLYAGVYSLAAAGSIAGTLTLDAQGNPDAVFIFKMGGAFSTAASSTVNLVDGASACNVFWVAEGAISMAASTIMKGTLIAHNGAISMGASGMLEGRMFSTTGAASVYSVVASLPTGCSATTVWTGAAGTSDWYTPGNWTRFVPDEFVETLIPTTLLAGRIFPVINSGIAAADTLTIQSMASVTITNSTLQVNGEIINNGILDAVNGSIEMISFSNQILAANTFKNNALKDLIISNSSSGGVSLGGALDVYGSLTYTGTGMKLVTNDFLTLKSNATNTAWIGDMTGNTISGKVSVERYISAYRAWRFLSIPTNTTQTIRETWQEGATSTAINPVPGFGIQLTGPGGTSDGFDLFTATPSMKTYNSATNGWTGVPGTGDTIKSAEGYMVFIRGDRTANVFNSLPTETVVRTKGDLYTGDQAPIIIPAGKFGAIGNPYASALDMRYITKTGVKNFFYLWDPNIGGLYGLGGYQTFSYNGSDYEVTPGMGSYGDSGTVSNYIQSGLAFLVQATGSGGSVTLKEAAKTSGSAQVSIAVRPTQAPITSPVGLSQAKLRTNLYGVNADNSTYIVDGILNNYGNNYNNKVDDMDAVKSANVGENLSIKTDNQLLVIERRHTITQQDTIFLTIGHVKVQKYRFEFSASFNQPGLTGYLEDSYLNTRTQLNMNGTTTADFSIVTIPGAYAANRFRIVFTQARVLPLTITSVKAYQSNKNIAVEWKVENEMNITQYTIEKSPNGDDYTIIGTVKAVNKISADYSWLDVNPLEGYSYYRIQSDATGEKAYSNVVKIFAGKAVQGISVYPNPISNGIINMQMNNEPGGIYAIQLLTSNGQVIIDKSINHSEGNNTETIAAPKLARGAYLLIVTNPGNVKTSNNIIY